MLPEFFYLDHGIWGDEKVKVKHGASRSNKLGVVLELLQPEIVYSDGGAGVVFHLVCPRQVFRPLGNANILIYRLSRFSRFSEGINLLGWRTNLYFAVWKTII